MAEEHVKELVEANPNPTLEEEAAAMDAAPVVEDTPAIPEKFMRDGKPDYEALAKAYSELEKKQSGKKDETNTEEEVAAEAASDEGDAADAGDESSNTDEEAARETADKAGLDYDALSKEYWDNGKLDDASYDKLAKAGIPKHLVDGYIRGQQAIINETKASVFAEVGGEQNYDSMISWAADNLKENEIAAYDKAVNSGDMNQIALAVKGLKARYEAAEGVEPKVTVGGTTSKANDTFKSWAQVQKAMSDPRYTNDPAYIAGVEAKLARSGDLL